MNSCFEKTHGSQTERDWERVNLLYEQCKLSNYFITPRPIKRTDKTIIYENISDLIPLLNPKKRPTDFYYLGIELAKLQKSTASNLVSTDKNDELLCSLGLNKKECNYINNALPLTFFHSDLCHGNIMQSLSKGVVILDPCPTFLLKHLVQPTYANAAVDIATLHMSILLVQPLKKQFFQNNRQLLKKSNEMLSGYLSVYGNDDTLKKLILKISYNQANLFVSQYKSRLCWPVSQIKAMLSNRKIKCLNNMVGNNEVL